MFARPLSIPFLVLLALAGCRARTPARLIFLQVGQGDCAVFSTAGTTMLIDAGPMDGSFDAGERIVIPALRRHGVDSVDLILVTHPDRDHIGGLGALHRAFPAASIVASAEFRAWPSMIESMKAAGVELGTVVWLPPDSTAKIGRFEVRMVCPSMDGRENDNDGSVCVRISDGRASAVLTGDAPSEVEDELIPRGDWKAQILKAGHHGSRGSTSTAWLRAVSPSWVIFSCGRDNRFGHPHLETIWRVTELGAKPLRTDRDGDLEFEATGNGWSLTK